jgi:hypothetical protein
VNELSPSLGVFDFLVSGMYINNATRKSDSASKFIMKSFTPLVATFFLMYFSNTAVSQFNFHDKDGNLESANKFFSENGSRNKIDGKDVNSARCNRPNSFSGNKDKSADDDDNDRRNYYDETGKRITRREFIAKYGKGPIDAAGDDERADIFPPKNN